MTSRNSGAGALSEGNSEAVSWADAVLLCVKPKDVEGLALELNGGMQGKLLLSAVAVTSAGRLQEIFQTERVVRAMPTVGAEALCSYTAMFAPEGLANEDANFAAWIFGQLGVAVWKGED